VKCAIVALLVLVAPLSAAEPFELKDGDKVVWLGSTLIEREQRYGYWETALTARWPDRKIRFRNLGWSGDTVFGDARVAFDLDKPGIGLKRMVDLALAEKPTVIFICYGANESFEGEAGLEKFKKGYEKLLDELKPAGARMVLLTPIPFMTAQSLPDPKEPNRRLGLFVDEIKKLAERRKLLCADLFTGFGSPQDCTDDGVHLNDAGYRATRKLLFQALENDRCLDPVMFRIDVLLRNAIIAKNQLYFYRWRPQNETYLFGFRKHEQGKNAKEVAEFDPLIAKAEEEIDKLKKPKPHRYEIVPAEKK
jgi:lysophospholipase L1-like esterase